MHFKIIFEKLKVQKRPKALKMLIRVYSIKQLYFESTNMRTEFGMSSQDTFNQNELAIELVFKFSIRAEVVESGLTSR